MNDQTKNNTSKEPSIQKNLIAISTLSYLSLFLAYALRILYGNIFSLEEFGILFSIIGFIFLISFFFSLGLAESFNYFGVKFFDNKNFMNLKQIFSYTLV